MNGCVPVLFSSWLPPFSRLLDWDRFSVRVPSLDLVPQLKTILERQPYIKLAANLPLALGAMWYRTSGSDQGDDLLGFLLVEMYLAMQAATHTPLKIMAEQILGLPTRLSHFEDDILANRSSALARQLPATIVSLVSRQAPRAFSAAYRGGVTIVTNRSRARGIEIFRCVPTTKNGHSYRESDPFDLVSDPPGVIDERLSQISSFACKDLLHGHQSAGVPHHDDPLSPTQVPHNHSLIRANREFYFPRPSSSSSSSSTTKRVSSKARSQSRIGSHPSHSASRGLGG